MAQVFCAWSSDYRTLRISGRDYPQGTYKLTFDSSIDPTEGGTVDWHGYFSGHASTCQRVIIEDEIYLDYANSMFENFSNCTSIQGIPNIHGNLLNTTRMFANTPRLTQPITLENMISINCLDATEMFANSGFREIVLNNINMKNCTSMAGMFKNAKAEVIEMTAIDTNSVRNANEMFAGCTNLTHIYGTGGYFDFAQSITSNNMFDGANLLTNWPNMGLDKRGAISIDDGGYINMSPYSVEFVDIRIREKYDTRANWLYYDPVLFAGELGIESDTLKFKVGDGAHHWSELSYLYGVDIDSETIVPNSEGELMVPIDRDTIIIEDGKIKAKIQNFADQVTIIQDSEGKLFLELDNRTIHINDAGQLESIVNIDNKTIKEGINGLYVPIDNNTIFVDTDGRIKSKGDLTPGVGLEWESPTSRTLDVKLGPTLEEDTNGVGVNFDGETIWFDPTAGSTIGGNGALRSTTTGSADGTVKVTYGGLTHNYDLSIPFADIVDGSTIKYENDKLVATAQVPEVDGETIVLDGNTLKVNADNDTLYVDGGKLKAKQVEPDEVTIITNGSGKLEAVKQMPDIDNVTIIVSEGKLTAVKQMPDIDNKTIVVDNDKLQVAIDNKSIVYDADNQWLEVAGPELVFDRGLYTIDTSEEVKVNVFVDGTTITINSEGALEAIGAPDVDEKTIIINEEGKVAANIDSETIIYDGNHLMVPHTYVTYTHGVGAYEDSEGLIVGAHTDEETIVYNAAEDWLEVPHIDIEVTDGIYTIYNSETNITTFGVNVDHDTIVYNSEQDWLEVNYNYVEGENGIYLRNDSEVTYIGIEVDGDTIYINSEGKLAGAPNVLVDGTTIIQDENDVISVHYDHDTIVYNSELGLEVPHIDILPISPIYIKEATSEVGGYYLGCGYDNTTITLNEKNELQTAVGGGWRKDPEEKVIATGTNVEKKRHHMLPDDDADYFLETVWFPNQLQEKSPITATVTHDASFMDETVELKYIPQWDIWYYDGRYWGSEGIAPDHPLNPHGYSIYVQRNKTVVQLHEDFETDPDTLTCTIKYGGHNWTKEYIDNQFVKVDGETIFVNSEGELQAGEQLKAGKWLKVSEGYIGLGNLCQGLAYNEESDCIYVKDATDSEVGGVKIDNETLKINDNGQLAFNLDGMLDRGLDATTGKIGHTNQFVGDLRQAGDPTSTLGIKWDDQGHLQEVERYDIPSMIGATAYTNGTRGFVPAPGSANRKSFLRGDGTWASLVDANLFSVIQSTGQWYVGTDRRSRVFSAEPTANQLVIAPLGWTIDRETEGIDVVYATEMTIGHMTLVARSNSQAETVVRATCYWLVLNL